MAKYRGSQSDQLQNEITELEKSINAPSLPDTLPVESGDESFKKRYGDLRRHLQTIQSQKDGEIDALKDQLDDATKAQIKFPKTDKEIADWSGRYPEVAKIIDTIAQKRANEVLETGEKRIANLEKLEQNMNKDKAEDHLRKLHPDFDKIRNSTAFHEWVMVQPQWVQDSLYKNSTDAMSASRAIDLYKVDTASKRRPSNGAGAAQAVSRSNSSAPAGRGQSKFSESQVSKMSSAEYEKNEPAIMDSMQKGSFVYDLSGAAR
jgi:hypothetical protein